MKNVKAIGTSMSSSCKLDQDKHGKNVDSKLYRGMHDSFFTPSTTSRFDIIFSICVYIRYQSNLKESHLIAIKRILRYLIRAQSIGLWYSK